jgi:hypothetical protein
MNQILHISIPEKVYLTLERTAKTTQQPLEKVAADWLEQVADAAQDSLDQFVGSFASGIKDAAEQHDKYFGETLAIR